MFFLNINTFKLLIFLGLLHCQELSTEVRRQELAKGSKILSALSQVAKLRHACLCAYEL